MRLLKLGGIFFLIISTFCVLVSCEEEKVNLTCGPYLEFNDLDADTASSLVLEESTINLNECFSTTYSDYKIEPGNNYVFSYYSYEDYGPEDAFSEDILLFEAPSNATDFYIDDFCEHKVYYSSGGFPFHHLDEGSPGCISGEKFEIDGPEGLMVGYDVNINIPYKDGWDSTNYAQFSKKFYLAKGADD